MGNSKDEVRKQVHEQLQELDADYMEKAGRMILERILSKEDYQRANSIFVYVNLPREPETRGLICQALADGKKVYVPKCITAHEMVAVQIQGPEELKAGRMGIYEPEYHGEAYPEGFDLGIIPCVAASKAGARLGHGAGFYDSFLTRIPMKKICLCYGKLLREDIPMEQGDVWMDEVVTEA